MKTHFRKLFVAALALVLITGCNGESSEPNKSSEEPTTSVTSEEEKQPLTKEEFDYAYSEIVRTIPLVVDKTKGDTVHSNSYRGDHNLPYNDLKEGNDLFLTTGGSLYKEDEENDIYLDVEFSVEWSHVEAEGYGEFEYEVDDNGRLTAIPGYPRYRPEYDRDIPIHVVPAKKPARLRAKITIGERNKTENFDMYLHPVQIIDWYRIRDIRDLEIGELIGVRGYVTGIFPDWNNATINDGEWGFGLFKLQDYANLFKVGDLIEAIGDFTVYNGLAQIQFIKSVKKVNASEHPEIKEPAWTTFTTDELADQLDRSTDDLTGALQDFDGALVKFDKPFRMVEVRDRDNEVIDISKMDITGKQHTDIIVEADTTDYPIRDKVTIKLSINYHMGGDNQLAIRDFFIANGTAPFYYEGHLSAYNEFVLGPYTADALILAD